MGYPNLELMEYHGPSLMNKVLGQTQVQLTKFLKANEKSDPDGEGPEMTMTGVATGHADRAVEPSPPDEAASPVVPVPVPVAIPPADLPEPSSAEPPEPKTTTATATTEEEKESEDKKEEAASDDSSDDGSGSDSSSESVPNDDQQEAPALAPKAKAKGKGKAKVKATAKQKAPAKGKSPKGTGKAKSSAAKSKSSKCSSAKRADASLSISDALGGRAKRRRSWAEGQWVSECNCFLQCIFCSFIKVCWCWRSESGVYELYCIKTVAFNHHTVYHHKIINNLTLCHVYTSNRLFGLLAILAVLEKLSRSATDADAEANLWAKCLWQSHRPAKRLLAERALGTWELGINIVCKI